MEHAISLSFTIPGEPMGKQRPKATTIGGHARVYTPKETIHYESNVVYFFRKAMEENHLFPDAILFKPNTPITAKIVAKFPITKQHYKYHKRTSSVELDNEGKLMKEGLIKPLKKPDTDNIAKICLDALNSFAYNDDSQITELIVNKIYTETPSVEITLYGELSDEQM